MAANLTLMKEMTPAYMHHITTRSSTVIDTQMEPFTTRITLKYLPTLFDRALSCAQTSAVTISFKIVPRHHLGLLPGLFYTFDIFFWLFLFLLGIAKSSTLYLSLMFE